MTVGSEYQIRKRSFCSSRWESNDPLMERRKAAYRAKRSRFSNCKNERGAHSARPKRTSYNIEYNGPKTGSPVREALSKALQHRPLASGISTYRPKAWEYDNRGGWKDHRRGRTQADKRDHRRPQSLTLCPKARSSCLHP